MSDDLTPRRPTRLHASLALGVGLLASSPEAHAESPPAPIEQPAAVVTLNKALAADGVDPDAPARRVLYTWTSDAQRELLSESEVLLLRERDANDRSAIFDQLRENERFGDHPIAKLLSRPEFRKRRFAWANPWATVQGWDQEQYGPSLIRVELREEAIIGLFTPGGADAWRFVDVSNAKVDQATVEAHPERLAAVYFMPVGQAPQRTGYPYDTMNMAAPVDALAVSHLGYREFVLCNEGMIKRWSIGDEASRGVLEQSALMLEELAGLLPVVERRADRSKPPFSWADWVGDEARDRHYARKHLWPAPFVKSPLWELYWSGLALGNERYTLTVENLTAISLKLKEAQIKARSHDPIDRQR